MEETKEDQSTFYGNIGLNWSMFGIYGAGLIGCVGLGFVSWFERTGRAGPHRTLINRLVSFNLDQVIFQYIFGHGIGTLRAVTGPLPGLVCKLSQIVTIFTGMNFCLFFLAITATKFTFVCILKRLPVMEDNLVSCLIANTVYLMTFLATCSKFYLGSVQRIEEKICNGFKTDDQTLKIPVASLVALGSLFGHLILSIPIMIEQRKDSYINRVIPLNQNNNANLGNKGVRVIIVLLLVLGTIVNHLLQKCDQHSSENCEILVHLNNSFVPSLAVTSLCGIFLFVKNLSIKRALFPDEIRQDLD